MYRPVRSVSFRQYYYSHKRPNAILVEVYTKDYPRPMFVRIVHRDGTYSLTTDQLYAKPFTLKTAKKHAAIILERGVI